tara:strand:+ start:116 stop:1039 length:924 start_codon:yes stop_codon:yes gene_type:complete
MVRGTRSATNHGTEQRVASRTYPGICKVAHSNACYVHLACMPSEKRFRHWDAALRYFEDHGGTPRRSGAERAHRHGGGEQAQTRSSRRVAPRPLVPSPPLPKAPKAPKAKRVLALDPPRSPPLKVEELDLDIALKDLSDVLTGSDKLFLFSDDELAAEVGRRTALRSTAVPSQDAAPPEPVGGPGRVVDTVCAPPIDLRCDETLDDPRTDAVRTQPRAAPVITYAFGRPKPLCFAFEVEAVMTERVWIRAPYSRWNDSKITDYMPRHKASVAAARKAQRSIAPFYMAHQKRGALTGTIPLSAIVPSP